MALIEKDGVRRSHDIQQVLLAADRARNLVQQILAFSRHEEQEKKPVDLRIVMKEAMKLIKSTIPSSIRTRQKITSKASVINADATQIHQVFMNLCTNAVHAMGERGGMLEVSLSPVEVGNDASISLPELKPGSYINLTISDTGAGIEPDIIGRIFDPFFTTKKIGEGTGLGLSVVYGIIRNHGGAIKVASAPGQGATFNIYLPLLEEIEPKDMAQVFEPVPTGHERILFVDDEKPLVDLAERMIFSLGYQVTSTTSSEEALRIFLSGPEQFDLVITDMTMPRMTGVELIKKILGVKPLIPVILCTGFSDYVNETKADQLGISAFMMKPFSRNNLAKIIRQVLKKE
jgi:CheY-like chemotaxis protein